MHASTSIIPTCYVSFTSEVSLESVVMACRVAKIELSITNFPAAGRRVIIFGPGE